MAYGYFDLAYAVKVHRHIIEKSGGLPGLRNQGTLESILEHVQNDLYYPEMEDKLGHLFFAINKSHCFNDGNKRAAIALSAYFMELNGFDFRVPRFIKQMENIAVEVAENRIGKPLLQKMVFSLLYEEDYSESLKLELLHALRSRE
jgi:death-on-curing protein